MALYQYGRPAAVMTALSPVTKWLSPRAETWSGSSRSSPAGEFPRPGGQDGSENVSASGHVRRDGCGHNGRYPPSKTFSDLEGNIDYAGSG